MKKHIVGTWRLVHSIGQDAIVREIQVTDEEWEFAWDFMGRMAAMTGPTRNEFLLLADVIGVSQLIETLNHEKPGQPVGRLANSKSLSRPGSRSRDQRCCM